MLTCFARAIITAVVLVGMSSLVAAQGAACGLRELIIPELTGRYREQLRVVGTVGTAKMEIFVSPKGKTFSVVISPPSGPRVCIVAAGNNWQAVDIPTPGQDL